MQVRSPALVLDSPHTLPTLETVTIDDPGPGEVRIQLVASGVCHTDISNVRDARYWPVVLGHEGAGIVESVGAGVSSVQVGDHVIISWRVPCGSRCRRCLKGRQDLCENIQATQALRVHRVDGTPSHVLLNAGTFCQYAVVPADGAIPIRRDMPLDRAAFIGCAVATGVGAALHTAVVEEGDSVVVFGAGGIGLNIVQGARLARAGLIIAIDLLEPKLELANKLGATHTFNPGKVDAVQAVLDLTGRGVDHAFEAVGHPAIMEQALRTLAPGGVLTFVGAAARDATFAFHPRAFLSKQQTMRGCIYGSVRPAIDFPLYVDWYKQGLLYLDELLSEVIDLQLAPSIPHETFRNDDSNRRSIRVSEQQMDIRTDAKLWRLTELLPNELQAQIARKPIVVLPFGTLEWHSYHLPIGLDSLKAEAICEQIAQTLGALLAPPTHWAVGGVPYPYTTKFDLTLIEALTRQVFQQMDAMGMRVMLAITGHFGLEQTLMIKRAALECMKSSSATIFAAGEFEVVTNKGYLGDHAAKWETSLLWAIRPDLVRLEQLDPDQPLDGILGQDPRSSASESLGQETINLIVARFAEIGERMLAQSVFQRAHYIEALAMGVRVLERLLVERSLKPKSQVPPVATPAYVQYLQAIVQGDYAAARRHAEIKFENLAA